MNISPYIYDKYPVLPIVRAMNWVQIANCEAITEFELMLKVEQWVLMSEKRGMVCRDS